LNFLVSGFGSRRISTKSPNYFVIRFFNTFFFYSLILFHFFLKLLLYGADGVRHGVILFCRFVDFTVYIVFPGISKFVNLVQFLLDFPCAPSVFFEAGLYLVLHVCEAAADQLDVEVIQDLSYLPCLICHFILLDLPLLVRVILLKYGLIINLSIFSCLVLLKHLMTIVEQLDVFKNVVDVIEVNLIASHIPIWARKGRF